MWLGNSSTYVKSRWWGYLPQKTNGELRQSVSEALTGFVSDTACGEPDYFMMLPIRWSVEYTRNGELCPSFPAPNEFVLVRVEKEAKRPML